ncbi:MAG: anti-sigma factor [Pirellulaceae bacterium]
MTCDELLKTLNEYVDDPTVLAICEEFAQHLAGCNPCQVVVDNIRQTIALYRAGQAYEVPAALESRLQDALRSRWQAKFGPRALPSPGTPGEG